MYVLLFKGQSKTGIPFLCRNKASCFLFKYRGGFSNISNVNFIVKDYPLHLSSNRCYFSYFPLEGMLSLLINGTTQKLKGCLIIPLSPLLTYNKTKIASREIHWIKGKTKNKNKEKITTTAAILRSIGNK